MAAPRRERCIRGISEEENAMVRQFFLVISILVLVHSTVTADEIHEATIRGDFARVKALLSANPGLANIRTAGGETPLHLASRQGRLEIVSLLIKSGADVNARDRNSETPLYEAAAMNRKDVAELLISSGADINSADKNGITPLKLALTINNSQIVELLRAHGAKE